MKKERFEKGDRVESLVEPVGEKGTVESCGTYLMNITWNKLWRNAKISISHDAVFTNDNGTDIFKIIK